jgi:transcriptional activator SPT7
LKYLLQGISENRAKTSLSDRELRNLLLDVKPHKSKWANDDRIGQEDLYEACEKVLIDLKNYTVSLKKNTIRFYSYLFIIRNMLHHF